MNKGQLKYIPNGKIDTEKWDRCIAGSENKRVYAYSWYLNLVCDRWDAIVFGDYKYIMPIPILSKIGFQYVSQPYFAQQLGIFPVPPEEIQNGFSIFFVKKFKIIDYQLNSQMDPKCFSSFTLSKRENLVLSMNCDYESLYLKYSQHTKRNINKAKQAKISVSKMLSSDEYCNNFESRYNMPDKYLVQLKQLIPFALENGIGEIYGAYSSADILCAAVFFLKSNNRVMYLSSFTTNLGRENRSIYALVDSFIQDKASTGLSLDFEGSSKEGLARFYKGFGAETEEYYHISSNKLHFITKLFNK